MDLDRSFGFLVNDVARLFGRRFDQNGKRLELTRAQCRTLGYLAQQATKLLQVGEFEERLGAIESVLGERLPVNEKGNRR